MKITNRIFGKLFLSGLFTFDVRQAADAVPLQSNDEERNESNKGCSLAAHTNSHRAATAFVGRKRQSLLLAQHSKLLNEADADPLEHP